MTHELADWARAMLNYNSEEYDPEMVINKLLRQDETVSNLQRDLSQRTAEYAAKVDDVIRLEKEVAALRYQVQNQTLRADDAVAAIEVWKRDFAGQRERIGELEKKYKESLEFVEAMRDVLISLQPHMGYLPQQKAFSVKMTVIESANEFLARAALEGKDG